MAKSYLSINSKISQVVGGHNSLVNKVGDLALLNTVGDSDLVSAINSILNEGGVDSAAIVNLLDSGQYIKIADLFTGDSGADIIVRAGSQTITGQKIFTAEPVFQSNAVVKKTADARIRLQSTNRRDSSEVLTFTHGSSGSILGWTDSDGTVSLNVLVVSNQSGTSPNPGKFEFYTGANTLIGTLDSATASNITTTLITKGKGDVLYLLNAPNSVNTTNIVDLAVTEGKLAALSVTEGKIGAQAVTEGKIASNAVTTIKITDDAVTRAKLANEVQLIIYDSAGVVVKTLYGAGS